MPLRLVEEDLQLVTSARVRGTRLRVRVRLLDSAAPGPGVYDVRVLQRGTTYRTVSRTHRLIVG